MAKAVKLPSGNWRVRVYAGTDANGKQQYKSFTENTERKAMLAALEWQEHYKDINNDSSNMTVGEAITEHINSISNILSPATIAGYNRIRKNRMQGIINRKLKSLTQKDIEAEINNEAAKYSAKTIANSFGLLHTVLAKYRPDFNYKVSLPEIYPTVITIPMDADLRKIYAASYNTEMELPILLASWLGLRVSEIRGLKMKNITETTLIIDTAIVQGEDGAVKKRTKEKASTRVLQLPKYIKNRIDLLITDDREYITALSGQAIYKRFVRICEKLEVGPFRFHDLRHTNATVMLEENIPDKYIAQRGGWGSEIYKKTYQHTTSNKHDSISEIINKRFESMIDDDKKTD